MDGSNGKEPFQNHGLLTIMPHHLVYKRSSDVGKKNSGRGSNLGRTIAGAYKLDSIFSPKRSNSRTASADSLPLLPTFPPLR